MLTQERLDEIRARSEAATKGPWTMSGTDMVVDLKRNHIATVHLTAHDTTHRFTKGNNAYFLAMARQDIPDLLEGIKRLKRWMRAWKQVAKKWYGIGRANSIELDHTHVAFEDCVAALQDIVRAVLDEQRCGIPQRIISPELEEQARAALGESNDLLTKSISYEFVTIPAGPFLMGDDQRTVVLPEYKIGKYPVTNAQYAAFVTATGHHAPRNWPSNQPDHPVTGVSWHDARDFCTWLGARLPTEAEWEKAARGTDGRIYPWGDEFDMGKCNTYESGIGDTTPVGKYSPEGDSPYGCVDIAGNVWEWCKDWHGDTRAFKVLRGGSWASTRIGVRSAYRDYDYPALRSENWGFRCCVASTENGK